MTHDQAARQIREAWDDFAAGREPPDVSTEATAVLAPPRDDEQPCFYVNTEIRDIAISEIR
jgi:hypothetical protein